VDKIFEKLWSNHLARVKETCKVKEALMDQAFIAKVPNLGETKGDDLALRMRIP
jgi:hypothetical protein